MTSFKRIRYSDQVHYLKWFSQFFMFEYKVFTTRTRPDYLINIIIHCVKIYGCLGFIRKICKKHVFTICFWISKLINNFWIFSWLRYIEKTNTSPFICTTDLYSLTVVFDKQLEIDSLFILTYEYELFNTRVLYLYFSLFV